MDKYISPRFYIRPSLLEALLLKYSSDSTEKSKGGKRRGEGEGGKDEKVWRTMF